MFTWIIIYEHKRVLDEIYKIGVVKFEPKLDINYIIMDSYLDKETIMKIPGVTGCRLPEIYTLD